MEKDIQKNKIEETILYISKKTSKYTEAPFYTCGEIKKELEKRKIELQDNDILIVSHDEGYQEEDCLSDPHYYFEVIRTREETDEEFQERFKMIEESIKRSKEARHKRYLELKEEFEPENK